MRRGIKLAIFIGVYLLLLGSIYAGLGAHSSKGLPSVGLQLGFISPTALLTVVGFGLMLFYYHNFNLSSIGFTLILASQTILLFRLFDDFWGKILVGGANWDKIYLRIERSGTVWKAVLATLVGFSGVIGKMGLLEILLCNLAQVAMYSLNARLCLDVMGVNDEGSMVVFLFGGCFALGLNAFIAPRDEGKQYRDISRHSGQLALLGACLVWTCFPSLIGEGAIQQRRALAYLNTHLIQTSSAIISISAGYWLFDKLDIEFLLPCILAGGVSSGALATCVFNPSISLFLGGLIGIVSAKTSTIRLKHESYPILAAFVLPAILGTLASLISIPLFGIGNYPQAVYPPFRHERGIQVGFQVAGLFTSAGLGGLLGLAVSLPTKLLLMEDYYIYLQQCGKEVRSQFQLLYHDYTQWDVGVQIQQLDAEGSARNLMKK